MVIKNQYFLAGAGALVVAAFVVLDVFLSPFIVFQFIFWPLIAIGIGVSIFYTNRFFYKREF